MTRPLHHDLLTAGEWQQARDAFSSLDQRGTGSVALDRIQQVVRQGDRGMLQSTAGEVSEGQWYRWVLEMKRKIDGCISIDEIAAF